MSASLLRTLLNIVKLATLVEGDPKAPFSIATTPRCRGGRYPFHWLLYFTLNTYLILLSVKQGGIEYHFKNLWYDSTWDWTPVSRAIGKHTNHHVADLNSTEVWTISFFSDLQFPRSIFQSFGDCSKCTKCNWYHRHLHGLQFSGKVLVFVYRFCFYFFHYCYLRIFHTS